MLDLVCRLLGGHRWRVLRTDSVGTIYGCERCAARRLEMSKPQK